VYDRFGNSFVSVLAAGIPVLSGFLGVLISNIPISLTSGLVPPPLFALMPIYFWSLVRPDLMPVAAIFAIGLAEDVLSGGPPGLWAATFLICYAFLDRQREFFAGLASIGAILGFATVMLMASFVAYGLVALVYAHTPPLQPLLVEDGVTIIFYIPVLLAMNAIQHNLIGPSRGI
jgi:rod shape-determining protein MreD